MTESNDLLRKALAVEEIPEDFDPKKIPQTGEEYIHYVMYEAKQCEEWLKADICKEKLKKPQKIICNEVHPTGCISAPEEFIPSLAWQQKTVADFSTFRLHIQKLKNSKNISQTSQFNGELQQWRNKCLAEPKLTEILSFNQKNICKILNFLLVWLNEVEDGCSIHNNHGVWLYALLSSLELPLMPENCFILREIARKCSEIRLKLNKSSPQQMYTPLNLFICLIGRYFHNFDLVDNVNEL